MRTGLIKQSGFTLLESILVLVIASSIVLLSIRQYQSYKIDSDVNQVLYNVDQLFQAASYYYQANCRNQVNQTTMVPIANSGALDPANSPTNPFSVDAYNDLYSNRYLRTLLPINPIVYYNPSSTPMKGYVVQFNLQTPQTQRVINLSSGGTVNAGAIYVWKIQVAVRLTDPTKASQYLSLLRGDCLSRQVGATVTRCPSVPAAPVAGDDYVVFERLPSLPTAQGNSGLNATNVMVKQFNQQYTTYPILYLTSGVTPVPPQNYLCGT
jgi:prepilin-type N-terminal cleavage/methylation domain-containing protein